MKVSGYDCEGVRVRGEAFLGGERESEVANPPHVRRVVRSVVSFHGSLYQKLCVSHRLSPRHALSLSLSRCNWRLECGVVLLELEEGSSETRREPGKWSWINRKRRSSEGEGRCGLMDHRVTFDPRDYACD